MLAVLLLGIGACGVAQSIEVANGVSVDSDHDGLSDAQEQALLVQFEPRFMISRDDCSSRPAEFVPFLARPVVQADNDTIYGQAFPHGGHPEQIELHYYDLWRKDCGQAGHALDAEHVSVLLDRDGVAGWKARYWYAASHENTVCDASQIARAGSLGAEQRGPTVWISNGKHAAFLSREICRRGCGADECRNEESLATQKIVNVGETAAAMNGATWAASPEWPLAGKMQRSDFSEARVARLDRLLADEIAWANPGKRPAQAAILGGDEALGGAATGVRATNSALTAADTQSSNALQKASDGVAKSFRSVLKALRGTGAGKGK